MSKGIRVSEKHGVNPCIPICFWCGKEKDEVALLGKLKGDREAPMYAVLNYEPCKECEEKMSKGMVIMEGTMEPVRPEMPKFRGSYPTGRWAVVPRESVAEEYRNYEGLYMLPENFSRLIGEGE